MNVDTAAAEAEQSAWRCRYCGTTGAFRLTWLQAKPVGTFSLAGVGMKFSAAARAGARCRPDLGGCGRPMEDVRLLAYLLHAGQVDKQGRPYFEHPAAVEAAVKAAGGTVAQRVAALLHDVVEDGRATLAQLADAGVPADALVLVDALTERPEERRAGPEGRAAYVARVLAVPDAVPVKEADLDHNEGRLDTVADPAVRDRLRGKYRRDRGQIAAWRAAQPDAGPG